MSPIGLHYMTMVFCMNIYTCRYDGQISDYFNLQPPSVEEYIWQTLISALDVNAFKKTKCLKFKKNYFLLIDNFF